MLGMLSGCHIDVEESSDVGGGLVTVWVGGLVSW